MAGDPAVPAVRHEVAVCAAEAECADMVLRFLRPGLQSGARVFIAVSPRVARLLSLAFGDRGSQVEFAAIAEFGRNPGRMIGALWDFITQNDGQRVHCVQEPLWPGRSAAEVREVLRHEALVNVAFLGQPLSLLCVYQQRLLSNSGRTGTELTHPMLRTSAGALASGSYLGDGLLPADCELPLEPPPAGTPSLTYCDDLREVRRMAQAVAVAAGLAADRAADLVLAVSEVAANTLRHSGGCGQFLAWHTATEVICEVRDGGTLTDPLVGRRRPDQLGPGHGLWVVNQVCDLVELRANQADTTIRMHIKIT